MTEADRSSAPGAVSATPGGRRPSRILLALVMGQVGVHASMSGLRLAAPLQTLNEGYGAVAVGMLMALFAAAPVLVALPSGRLIDRLGYHRPVRIATAVAMAGALAAVVSTFLDGAAHFALLCLAAMLSGAGTNLGMLSVQRAGGAWATDATERVRVFSWIGVAPSFSNMIGAVFAGIMIDLAGFACAYALMLALPLLTAWSARQVPASVSVSRPRDERHGSTWTLLRSPGFRRILLCNWLMSTCWDANTFAVPILGHERGFSASTIGLILGTFTMSVTGVRLLIPMMAHRLEEATVIRWAMVGTALIFALYPWATSAWMMMALSVLLGVTLGCTQPMVLVMLHQASPHERHGEALALRSMVMNASSTVMPLLFGAAGAVVGAASLFWAVGATVGAGSWGAKGLRELVPTASPETPPPRG